MTQAAVNPPHENFLSKKDEGDTALVRQLAVRVRGLRDRTIAEIGRVVVGMEPVTHQFLIALLAAGQLSAWSDTALI